MNLIKKVHCGRVLGVWVSSALSITSCNTKQGEAGVQSSSPNVTPTPGSLTELTVQIGDPTDDQPDDKFKFEFTSASPTFALDDQLQPIATSDIIGRKTNLGLGKKVEMSPSFSQKIGSGEIELAGNGAKTVAEFSNCEVEDFRDRLAELLAATSFMARSFNTDRKIIAPMCFEMGKIPPAPRQKVRRNPIQISLSGSIIPIPEIQSV